MKSSELQEEAVIVDTGTIVAIAVTLCAAVFVVIICAVSAVSSVTGIRQTNDEDSQA